MKVLSVTAAVWEDKGRILLARRAPGESHSGRWEFPGGKIAPGESPAACMVRELQEEFSVGITHTQFLMESVWTYAALEVRLQVFRVKGPVSAITLSVHDRIDWVLPSRLLSYDLLEADVAVARHLAAGDAP